MIVTQDTGVTLAGMGEMRVSADVGATLGCLGLGSCVALCVYEPISKVGGVAHIVLPESNRAVDESTCGRFADTAVPWLIAEVCRRGGVSSRLIAKLVGGAQMIQAQGFENTIQMGMRNVEAVRMALQKEGLRPAAEDTGGHQGRSVWLEISSGILTVKSAYGSRRQL